MEHKPHQNMIRVTDLFTILAILTVGMIFFWVGQRSQAQGLTESDAVDCLQQDNYMDCVNIQNMEQFFEEDPVRLIHMYITPIQNSALVWMSARLA